MKPAQYQHPKPGDASDRRKVRPVICYPVDSLVQPDLTSYRGARQGWEKLSETIVPPREAGMLRRSRGVLLPDRQHRRPSGRGPQSLVGGQSSANASSAVRHARFTQRT